MQENPAAFQFLPHHLAGVRSERCSLSPGPVVCVADLFLVLTKQMLSGFQAPIPTAGRRRLLSHCFLFLTFLLSEHWFSGRPCECGHVCAPASVLLLHFIWISSPVLGSLLSTPPLYPRVTSPMRNKRGHLGLR